eukprot:scaffold5681_cov377-Prasinococcus_capsulatus_cf.AAC.13
MAVLLTVPLQDKEVSLSFGSTPGKDSSIELEALLSGGNTICKGTKASPPQNPRQQGIDEGYQHRQGSGL